MNALVIRTVTRYSMESFLAQPKNGRSSVAFSKALLGTLVFLKKIGNLVICLSSMLQALAQEVGPIEVTLVPIIVA